MQQNFSTNRLQQSKLLEIVTSKLQACRSNHYVMLSVFCSYNYRCGVASHPKIIIYLAEGVQGFAWWWILWHLWTEPGHIFVSICPNFTRLPLRLTYFFQGEFEFPNASTWTDEELGIPAE